MTSSLSNDDDAAISCPPRHAATWVSPQSPNGRATSKWTPRRWNGTANASWCLCAGRTPSQSTGSDDGGHAPGRWDSWSWWSWWPWPKCPCPLPPESRAGAYASEQPIPTKLLVFNLLIASRDGVRDLRLRNTRSALSAVTSFPRSTCISSSRLSRSHTYVLINL